jgi:glycosyltransferase involved in cell wall biosynthesis
MPNDDDRPVALSAFILTKNESGNLPKCLETLRGCCDDLYVVDSFSTDDTCDIARRYGAVVVQHAFEGHTKQRAWALKTLPFRHEWVIALDADHRVTPELAAELRHVFADPPDDVSGFFIKRRQIFRGRWLRHGGYYPKYMLKVFKHAMAFLDDHEFDYRFYVHGPTRVLEHDILESNENEWSISFFVQKHLKFATELATEELERENLPYLVKPALFGNSDQRTLWLKQRWRTLPLYVRPVLLFLYRYFFRAGFLDGKEGFVFYILQSFWFRLMVDVRIEEMRKESA